ncbi:tetratricopeptide repeat protein [Polluticoccus soli]|uniref:tetratricopeptide repeat protein n=1 Tax=Polluticoccus soli TaxID=3034150 RepID=UPI0023E13B41|nr:tetratricopeptide repeat protein [Flavipsychrobacter sp. JY13-12]
MKKQVLMMAAVAFTVSVSAQSLQEGIKMYHYERYESAKKQLTTLAATDPVANYYLGLSELKSGNVDNAATIFSKYPENYANIAGTAMVNFAKGKTSEGTQIAQGLAAKAKKKEWEQLKFAADAITNSPNSNKQLAIDWYKEVLARNGNNATSELLIAMGDAYQEIPGGGGQAQTSYEKASEKDAKNSLAFSRQGKLWYDARNYDLALGTWKKASDADPENPLPYRDLAQAYAASGKYDLALQNVEKYYERSDKTLADKASYADILFLSKNYDRAAQMAQEIINAGMNTPRVYGLLGFAQYNMKDSLSKVNAIKNTRVYIEKYDKKVPASDYITFGRMFLTTNQPDSAEVYFNKALALDTTGAAKIGTYREIAEAFRVGKNWKKSAEWYTKVIALPEANATDYFWAGAMYYYDNNYADAGKMFETMETKFPDQPSATYWRGRVAAAIDNEAKEGKAEAFYTKWLDKVGPTYDKKADLMQAYQYLFLLSYNKNDKDAMKKYRDLILAIDPKNELVKQIDAAAKKS